MKGLFDFENIKSNNKVVVIGIGGAGCNAINKMIDEKISNVSFYALNTDKQSLALSNAKNKLLLGEKITNGIGAGGDPKIGRKATLDSIVEIKEIVQGATLVFIAAGMGGGTGTGGAPIIAKSAKYTGALVVGIATRPFLMEGSKRNKIAIDGINKFKEGTDSLIVVSNDKLLLEKGDMPINEAFKEVDDVLMRAVKMVSELILKPGLISIDFADIKNNLKGGGYAIIGIGKGEGESRVEMAVKSALATPLSDQSILKATRGICHVITGPKVSLYESTAVVSKIIEHTNHHLNLKFGISIDDKLNDQIHVSIIASGFNDKIDFSKPNINLYEEHKNNIENETITSSSIEDIIPSFLNKKDF